MIMVVTTNCRQFEIDTEEDMELQNRGGKGTSVWTCAGLSKRKNEYIISVDFKEV